MSVCECMSLYKTLHRVVAGACFGAQYKSVLEITQTHIHIHTYSVKTWGLCFFLCVALVWFDLAGSCSQPWLERARGPRRLREMASHNSIRRGATSCGPNLQATKQI